ncbi:hypothetical protein ACFX19_043682 [Malus domestica]
MSRRPVNLNLNTSRWFGNSGGALLSGSSYSCHIVNWIYIGTLILSWYQIGLSLCEAKRPHVTQLLLSTCSFKKSPHVQKRVESCPTSVRDNVWYTSISLAYSYSSRGGGHLKGAVSRVEGDYSCTVEVQRAISILKKAYGDSMHKVLHVGLDTCTVVSKLLSEEETEAWGVEPYDVEDAGRSCKSLVRKGIVRVVDIKYPLPYMPKSFSLVLVSDALDYLSERYLNRTLPDLARVSADGLVVFTGYPRKQRAKAAEVSKFGRAVSNCCTYISCLFYEP